MHVLEGFGFPNPAQRGWYRPGTAWAAENLEMTNSYCRNAGILLELWVVSPECCALRTATVPQHHWAWFLKEKSCPREPGC